MDFGCGSHFSDSTGLILYLAGVKHTDSLELGNTLSGFETGAVLDLVHWLKDQLLSRTTALDLGQIDLSRLDQLHHVALRYRCDTDIPFEAVRIVRDNIFSSRWDNQRYDLVTSNAVLEHVEEPDRIWNRLVHLVEVGGVMHHVIDFRDHRAYYQPDRYDPLPKLGMNGKWSDPHTNGWRFRDWMQLVKSTGNFRILECKIFAADNSILTAVEENSENIASCEMILKKVC
jgi:hypothetical protein